MLANQFNSQTLIVSIICAVVFVCLMAFIALVSTGNRHRKIYKESQEIIAKISEISHPSFSQPPTIVPIRVFDKALDQFVLPKTELPNTKLPQSVALMEGFIDSKKSKNPVEFVDTKLEFFDNGFRFSDGVNTFETTFRNLFYCPTWIDIQSKSLIFSFATYDDQISPKFQFFSFEELKHCQKWLLNQKITLGVNK